MDLHHKLRTCQHYVPKKSTSWITQVLEDILLVTTHVWSSTILVTLREGEEVEGKGINSCLDKLVLDHWDHAHGSTGSLGSCTW